MAYHLYIECKKIFVPCGKEWKGMILCTRCIRTRREQETNIRQMFKMLFKKVRN